MHQGPWKFPKFLISNLRSHTQDNPILPLTNIIYYAQFLVSFLSFLGKKNVLSFVLKLEKKVTITIFMNAENSSLQVDVKRSNLMVL